jgi:hypothetical protein
MSLDSLGVGLEGDHHTFTKFYGAHHKQGSFRRNLDHLGHFTPFLRAHTKGSFRGNLDHLGLFTNFLKISPNRLGGKASKSNKLTGSHSNKSMRGAQTNATNAMQSQATNAQHTLSISQDATQESRRLKRGDTMEEINK